MPYLGPPPSQTFVAVDYQDLTGVTGSPAKRGFTLDNGVTNANEIEVFVNNVRQEPGVAYTVSGTALTMTGDVETTDDFYIVYQGRAVGTVGLPNASVTTANIASGAVTRAKMANDLSGTNLAIDTTSSTFKMTDLTSNAFYRTGTFTPAFSSQSATDPDASVISAYNTQAGFYTRIGDLVHIDLTITTNSSSWSYTNGGANGQPLTIVGLPFTIKNTTSYFPSISVGAFNTWTGWTQGYTPMGYGNTNTKRIYMTYATLNGVVSLQTSSVATFGSSITVSMTYETDDA